MLDEEERRVYSLVCGFSFRRPHSLSSACFFAAHFVELVEAEASERPSTPVCSFFR